MFLRHTASHNAPLPQPQAGPTVKVRKQAPVRTGTAGKATAAAAAPAAHEALKRLLKFEDEVRDIAGERHLVHFIANKTQELLSARQVIVCQVEPRHKPSQKSKDAARVLFSRVRVAAISSMGVIDRNSPKIHQIEQLVRRHAAKQDAGQVSQLMAAAYAERNSSDTAHATGPYPWLLWLPLKNRDGTIFAVVLLAREVVWHQAELDLATRLAKTYAHAWQGLQPRKSWWRRALRSSWHSLTLKLLLLLTLVVLAAVPVRLSAVAPLKTVAAEPRIIAAPMQGVIRDILVAPSTPVKKGQVLIRLEDTTLRNDYQIAEKKVRVAEARLRKAADGAFDDARSKHDYGLAKAELALAQAERDYAAALLAHSVIRAPADGVVIYGSRKDWIGQPVATGEKIMQLANPKKFEFRIDLPVKDAILLKPGADVDVFLDSDPLRTVKARVEQVSFEAIVTPQNVLAYRIFARLEHPGGAGPAARIGHHGTAKLYGGQVPLAFYLLRRPLTALRQYFGL